MSNLSEQEIIQLCKKDLSNFTDLYDLYINHVYRYVYSRLENTVDTEDIVSDTFLKALEKINTYEQIENRSIKWWLFAISRNLMIDKFRKPQLLVFNEEYSTSWSDESIIDNAINKDILSRIEKFILEFDPPIPEIVQLRIWEEMSFDEIAKILNRQTGSVKMAYYRALEKINKEFLQEKELING